MEITKQSQSKHLSRIEVKNTPAIFYVPHQDDDALAMALGIREHIVAGRAVYVHLYSDGINAPLRDILNGKLPCPLHKTPHHFNLTLDDVVTGRTHEFRQSLHALGVHPDHIFETGWSDLEPLQDYNRFKAKLRSLIVSYEAKFPGASHKCISGEYDKDSVGRNPTHRACWDAARDLVNEYPGGWPPTKAHWDFRFYRTYTYYKSPDKRIAQYIWSMPEHLPFKRRALDQYKHWDPKRGELAWGYHSVKTLIDAAYNDPHVYMDMLDNDPTNPEYDNFLRREVQQSPFAPYWAPGPHRMKALHTKPGAHHAAAKNKSSQEDAILVQQKGESKVVQEEPDAGLTLQIQEAPPAHIDVQGPSEEAERQEMENILKTYETLQKTNGVTGYTYWDRLHHLP
ncbi:hypothetical protein BGZ73_004176 [Actinomortierella ambigua]|nr:hypothetical protein BGZ73_004176 [Actinomortierella ambigua]